MRVGIVEDQPLLQEVLAEALASRGLTVVGRAQDASRAMAFVAAARPDVVLLDIRLPPTHTDEGLRLAEQIRTEHPSVGVLMLSSYGEIRLAQRLLAMPDGARAVGYLLKDQVGNLDELVEAIRRVAADEVVIDRQLIVRLMSRGPAEKTLDRLSPHERRILALVAQGRSNLGIAQELACQVSTVEKHMTTITTKLGLSTMEEPVRREVNVRVLAALTFLRAAPPSFPTSLVPGGLR